MAQHEPVARIKALYRNETMVKIQQLMAATLMNIEKIVSARPSE